jgi:glutamate-1-semialdehyde aminotransferase
LTAKRMQLLCELVPAAKRLALLNNPTDAVNESLRLVGITAHVRAHGRSGRS